MTGHLQFANLQGWQDQLPSWEELEKNAKEQSKQAVPPPQQNPAPAR